MTAGPTTLQLGLTNVLTDAFGAHPTLGGPLNLNDGATYTLTYPDGLELAPPPRTVGMSGNVRTQGERAVRALYRSAREVRLGLIVGPAANYAAFVATIRQLLLWVHAAPQTPITIQWQPPNASAPVYLDVLAAASDIPADEGDWLRLQFEPIELLFICRPGLRGDRRTLQNLVVNPGFSAPSGPGVQVFTDTLANLNAYTVQSGSSPTQNPANGYPDIVGADAPVRYYRLDEASGTTAYDVSGSGANATYAGSPTLGVAGAISGDSDTAITGNGTTQYASATANANGLPTGSAAWSLEAWVKIAANPSGLIVANSIGNWSSDAAYIGVTSTGKAEVGVVGVVTLDSSGALSLNTWHHIVGVFAGGAGGALTIYVDGASSGSTTTTPNVAYGAGIGNYVGAGQGPIHYFAGSLDEVAVYATALSSARISAHYSAGHSGVTGTVANAMTVPAGTTLAFGSPAWGAVNTWQVRFRWAPAGSSPVFYLMLAYVDSADQVFAQFSASAMRLFQRISGSANQLATAAVTMTPGAWFWAQVTLYPSPGGPGVNAVGADAVPAQVTLLTDNAGAPGAVVATLGPVAATSVVNGILAQPRIEALTAAVVIGGAFANVQSVSLFGPGGWTFQSITNGASPTAPCAGAWEQTVANTYPGGPVSSVGAARIDLPPAGTVDSCWRLYSGGAVTGANALAAIPIAASGNTLALSAWAKSTGLSANAQLRLVASEYDSNGNFLRQTTIVTLNGNQGVWTQLSGTVTTGASAAYLDLMLRVVDTTTPGESAGATIWFDNCQCWNETTTGQTAMPYCELRFPQSPAQLVVSGLLGDLPAPCALAFGSLLASWPTGSTLVYAIGRMAQPSATARLVGASYGWFDGTRAPPTATPALDPASWGGFFVSAAIGSGWNPRAFSAHASDLLGVYHLFCRFLSQQSLGNLGNISVRVTMQTLLNPWYGLANQSDQIAYFYGGFLYPVAASNAWAALDTGQIAIPAFSLGALTDPAQNYLTPRPQWGDATGGGSTAEINWQMLLPVDGSLVQGVVNNPSNGLVNVTSQWLWAYIDGLLTNRAGAADGPAWTYSLEATPQPNEAHAGGGPGSQTTGSINVNSGADPYLTLDPTSATTNAANGGGVSQGVNVLAAYVADGSGDVLPFYGEISYSPLYLYPR